MEAESKMIANAKVAFFIATDSFNDAIVIVTLTGKVNPEALLDKRAAHC